MDESGDLSPYNHYYGIALSFNLKVRQCKYKNFSDRCMKVIEILKVSREIIEMLQKSCIHIGDVRYVGLYEDYESLMARDFVQLTMRSKDHSEVMDALKRQQALISRMAEKVEKQSFALDFGSDLLANFTSDGIIWLVAKLLKKR